jgi:hypothetical protein
MTPIHLQSDFLLKVLSEDTLPARFYRVFFDKWEVRDLPEDDKALARLLLSLAIHFRAERHFAGSRASLCEEYGISRDKAFRLIKSLREQYPVIDGRTSFPIQTEGGHDLVVRVLPGENVTLEVVEMTDFIEGEGFAETQEDYINEEGDRVIVIQGPRVRTIEDAIATKKIDLEEWIVTDPYLNSWEGFCKTKDDEIKIVPMHQVSLRLKPKVLRKQEFPALQPVQIQGGAPSLPRHSGRKRMKRALIIPDPQIGYKRNLRTGVFEPLHDRRSMSLALTLAEIIRPDRIVILGDWLDLAEWSTHFARKPEFAQTTQPALAEGAWWINCLRGLTAGPIDFIPGNHEDRVNKAMVENMQAAYGLTSLDGIEEIPLLGIDNLLGLSKMGVTCHADYPDGEVWINEGLRAIHGELARSQYGATAQAILKEIGVSTIYGHIHRHESMSKTIHERGQIRLITAFSPGCLCRLEAGVVPAARSRVNWQHGLGIVDYDESGIQHNIMPVQISNQCFVYNGEAFVGMNLEEKISNDTGWDLRWELHPSRENQRYSSVTA